MFNLIRKDLTLGVHPMFFVMPVLTGALMFVPGWLYFMVPLYFCWITVPNMFSGIPKPERPDVHRDDARNQNGYGERKGIRDRHP